MKRLSSFVLVVAMLLTFTACGGNAAPTDKPDSVADTSVADLTDSASSTDASEANETVTLEVGLLGTALKPVGVIVADALGYLEEEGVDVNFQQVSSMNDAYLAVSTGDLDVYLFSSTAAATFIAQGTTTLRVFGGTASEGAEIMAKKDSGIVLNSAEDFVGLTIAVAMPETGQMVLKNYLLENGYTIGAPGEDADVTFIYVATGAIEGCAKGEYDLCITNSVMGYYADEYGVDVVAGVDDFVEVYPCCRQTCNQNTYETEFDALVKFEIATLRGHEYYLENMEETLDIAVDYTGQDRDFLQAQLYGIGDYTPRMRLSLDPDKDACINFYNAMMNIGEISDTIDVDWSDYVVTNVYETALQTLMDREPDNDLWQEFYTYFEANNT